MLKKLTNLLFEDEAEDLEEEEEIEYVAPVAKKKKPVETHIEEMDAPKEAVSMKRIDVTQPIPTVKQNTYQTSQEPVFKKPVNNVQHASPRPISVAPVVEERPKIGLSIDEVLPSESSAKPVPVQPVTKPVKQSKKASVGVYEFQPVISPIFGVDDKDLEAVASVRTAHTTVKVESNVSKIISPIYGLNREAEPIRIQKTVEKSNEVEKLSSGSLNTKVAEERVPEFSLDDILKMRDEEYREEPTERTNSDFLFPPLDLDNEEDENLIDETVVLDRREIHSEPIEKKMMHGKE